MELFDPAVANMMQYRSGLEADRLRQNREALRFRQQQERQNLQYQRLLYDIQRKERLDEEKRNNELLGTLWQAATDEGTPREVFQYLRTMADEYKKVMTPQQQDALDITLARGLYSKEDRMQDEYVRIKGRRPMLPPDVELSEGNLMQVADTKLAQVEYDYGLRAYLAGGKDKLGEDSQPSLVPIGVLGEGETASRVYAFKNAATGQTQILDTKTSIPGDLYKKAVNGGFGPTMMERYDLIPFEPSGRVMTIGDQQYHVFTGVKVTDGTPTTASIPLGPQPARAIKESSEPIMSPPAKANEVLGWIQGFSDGNLEKDKAGANIGWLNQVEDLLGTEIDQTQLDKRTGLPPLTSPYGIKMKNLQERFNASYPGFAIAPIPQTTMKEGKPRIVGEAVGFDFWLFDRDTVFMENPSWIIFPAQSRQQFFVNSKPKAAWYTNEIAGKGKHVWYDSYGRYLPQYLGVEPGTNVEE